MTGPGWSAVVVAVATAVVGTLAAADDPLVTESRRREQETQQVRLAVHFDEFCRKGSISETFAGFSGLRGLCPPEDLNLQWDAVLVLSGGRARLECDRPGWETTTAKMWAKRRECTSDGQASGTFFPDGNANGSFLWGVIGRNARVTELKHFYWQPVVFQLRGLTPGLNTQLASDLKAGSVVAAGGKRYLDYAATQNDRVKTRVRVDPDGGHAARQLSYFVDGRVTNQSDILYSDRGRGVVPSGWTTTGFSPGGQVKNVHKATVTGVQFDPPVTDADFKTVFPEGCLVLDARDGGMSRAGPGGELTRLDPDTMQPARGVGPRLLRRWYTLGLLSAMIVLTGVAVIRRRRRVASVSPS